MIDELVEKIESEEVIKKTRAKPKSKKQCMNPGLVPMRKQIAGAMYECVGIPKSQVEYYKSKGYSVDGVNKS